MEFWALRHRDMKEKIGKMKRVKMEALGYPVLFQRKSILIYKPHIGEWLFQMKVLVAV